MMFLSHDNQRVIINLMVDFVEKLKIRLRLPKEDLL